MIDQPDIFHELVLTALGDASGGGRWRRKVAEPPQDMAAAPPPPPAEGAEAAEAAMVRAVTDMAPAETSYSAPASLPHTSRPVCVDDARAFYFICAPAGLTATGGGGGGSFDCSDTRRG